MSTSPFKVVKLLPLVLILLRLEGSSDTAPLRGVSIVRLFLLYLLSVEAPLELYDDFWSPLSKEPDVGVCCLQLVSQSGDSIAVLVDDEEDDEDDDDNSGEDFCPSSEGSDGPVKLDSGSFCITGATEAVGLPNAGVRSDKRRLSEDF